jgi:putative two-component system response regulator
MNAKGNIHPYRVLSIDDDPTALEILELYCNDMGFQFYGLDQPAEALDFALSIRPDVILTDAMMPGISGFDLCQRFRDHPLLALVPVVMVTSLDAKEDKIRAIEAGAQEFLTKPIDRMELGARVRSLGRMRRLIETLDSADRVLDSLALCAEARDHTTGQHCERLKQQGREFGEFLGLDASSIVALERAGYLHDIGKVAIPDAVLQKPGKLTDEEWVVMKSHSKIGADLLSPLNTMADVIPIVRHHHERWDGRGYPDGFRNEAIPFLARVFQLLDAWDALTNARPYKAAMTASDALKLLEQEAAEGRWDPSLFAHFKDWKSRT